MKTFLAILLGFGCALIFCWVVVYHMEGKWAIVAFVTVFGMIHLARWDGAYGERRKRGEME